MTFIYYTIAGVALYFGADWLLNRIERARGQRFEHRDVVYFAIILVLALTSFSLINAYFAK